MKDSDRILYIWPHIRQHRKSFQIIRERLKPLIKHFQQLHAHRFLNKDKERSRESDSGRGMEGEAGNLMKTVNDKEEEKLHFVQRIWLKVNFKTLSFVCKCWVAYQFHCATECR